MRLSLRIVRPIRVLLAVAPVFIAFSLQTANAAWPERAITIIVPFPEGGANDLLGRLLAEELEPKLGQKVVVQNREGGVGNIGLTEAAHAGSNGYTLLVTTNALLINPAIDPRLTETAYDPIKSFEPIAYLGAAPNVIISRASSTIKSIADLVAQAKAHPGKIKYASPGTGSSSELAVELLKQRTHIDIRGLSLEGSDPALMAVLSGVTDLASVGLGGLIDQMHTGQIQCLVQTGAERWDGLPDVPTMAEAGIPDAVVETSQMFFAPASTAGSTVGKLERATEEILQRPEVKARMLKAGFLADFEGSSELTARIAREMPMWRHIVESAGIARK